MAVDSARVTASANLTVRTAGPLVSAVIATFDTMLSSSVRRTSLDLRSENDQMLDISALIGVSGKVSGSFCLSFARPTAAAAVSRFTGLEVDPDSPLVIDGVGEFTNVIVGNAKDNIDLALNLGIPNVVHGPEHAISFPGEAKPMRVCFESDLGPLLVDFGFTCANLNAW